MLPHLRQDRFEALLDDKFRGFPPPKYKRERNNKDERLKNMEYLYSLLMDIDIGLKFSNFLHFPDTSCTLSELDGLCDEYDACLGAIAGIYFASNNSYACVAGDSDSGNILLLADRWLAEQLGKEVRLSNLKKESQRGASPLLITNSPSPYQGEGDKGDRVTSKISKGVGLIIISSGFYWTYNQKRSKIE